MFGFRCYYSNCCLTVARGFLTAQPASLATTQCLQSAGLGKRAALRGEQSVLHEIPYEHLQRSYRRHLQQIHTGRRPDQAVINISESHRKSPLLDVTTLLMSWSYRQCAPCRPSLGQWPSFAEWQGWSSVSL